MKKAWMALAAFVTLACANAWAVIPENGWWWNPDESGRGFNIEIQDNLLFFSSFGYDASGNPAWMTAGGAMSGERDFSATLYLASHGQCFGCPYVKPTLTPAGTVTLHFTSSQTAQLTINGVSVNVQREDFWAYTSAPEAMLGEWSSVIGAAGDIFDAERIDYYQRLTGSNGPYIGGNRLGSGGTSNVAVTYYDGTQHTWAALLDSSSSYYRFFVYNQTGFNRVEGQFWIYAKGGSPSGTGTFFQAFKTASYARLSTGSGPASSKALQAAPDSEARDAALFSKVRNADAAAPDAAVLEAARRLESMMKARNAVKE